jgi:GTP-binding protein EngB required for normal cell division
MHAEAHTIGADSTVVESIVQAPRRVPVRGFARLAAYLRGKEILILGPGNAGKSKFAQYLRLAALDPEGIREMTYAVTKSPAFVLGVGGDEGIELKVRRAVDTCGQVGPVQHALLVARRRPHVVIVMLDCSADPRSVLRWLCLFCDALDSILRKAPAVDRRLQEIVVILNKRDKIDDREFAKLRQAVRKALERFLTVVWGADRVRSIPILESISVRTGHGTALIDGVIAQLAERLAGRPDRPAGVVRPRLVAVSPVGPHPGPSRPSYRPAPIPSSPPGPPAAPAPAA